MSLWICADEICLESRLYDFTKTFDAAEGAALTAKVCADTRYQLYVNGSLACEGPCQGSEYVRYYETVDLTPFLKVGENTLRARVLHVQEGSFISLYRGSRAAFWFHGDLTQNGETIHLGSDESWSCVRDDSVRMYHWPGVHTSVAPFEEVYGDPVLVPQTVKGMYEPFANKSGYRHFGLREKYPIAPRPIPQMQEFPRKTMTVVRRGESFVELDAGVYTTAKVTLNFKAKADAVVRVIYSECYSVENEAGQRYKGRRDAFDDPTARLDGVVDTLHATGKDQSFSPFWYRSFRFIRLEFPADAEFELADLNYGTYFYPLDEAGSFVCSNDRYNEMWKISRNTVLCCMHEMYVDCPFYEQQQYDMDSALEMLFTFRLGSDTLMPYKSVTDLAHSQIHDGMLQANYPSVDVQIIPDFTLFWVLMLRDYLRYTGEKDKAKTLLGTVDKALEGFSNLINANGLIDPTPYWAFVDWVPAWPFGTPPGGNEEPLTVTCFMYAAALKAAAEIAAKTGRSERAAEYNRRAKEMIQSVNRLCYDAEVGLYQNTPSRKEYSQHTTLWAILSGAVTGEEAGKLVDRTFSGDVPVSVCTFSMNHYMFRALEKADRYCYAPKLFAGWETMLDLHCTTWCENPDSPRSECHGWSSAPAYEFSAMVLGVYPTEDGYASVRIKPHVDDLGLTWAKGTVPTPYGVISVAWEKADGVLKVDVTLPENSEMKATLELPDGQVLELCDTQTKATCQLN